MSRPGISVQVRKSADAGKLRWWETVQFGVAAGPPSFVLSDFGGDYTGWVRLAKGMGCEIVRTNFSSGAGTPFGSLHDACIAAGLEVCALMIIQHDSLKTLSATQAEATDMVSRYPGIRKV